MRSICPTWGPLPGVRTRAHPAPSAATIPSRESRMLAICSSTVPRWPGRWMAFPPRAISMRPMLVIGRPFVSYRSLFERRLSRRNPGGEVGKGGFTPPPGSSQAPQDLVEVGMAHLLDPVADTRHRVAQREAPAEVDRGAEQHQVAGDGVDRRLELADLFGGTPWQGARGPRPGTPRRPSGCCPGRGDAGPPAWRRGSLPPAPPRRWASPRGGALGRLPPRARPALAPCR